jgi:hypothetical protein
MDMERNSHSGWVPLPGFAESAAAEDQGPAPERAGRAGRTGSARNMGLRHVRHVPAYHDN